MAEPQRTTSIEYVHCPRAKSWMTPCIVRDGHTALDGNECVGCSITPWKAIEMLSVKYPPASADAPPTTADESADKLKELVAEYVETK